jgi:hypothetical protein
LHCDDVDCFERVVAKEKSQKDSVAHFIPIKKKNEGGKDSLAVEKSTTMNHHKEEPKITWVIRVIMIF